MARNTQHTRLQLLRFSIIVFLLARQYRSTGLNHVWEHYHSSLTKHAMSFCARFFDLGIYNPQALACYNIKHKALSVHVIIIIVFFLINIIVIVISERRVFCFGFVTKDFLWMCEEVQNAEEDQAINVEESVWNLA